MMPIIVIPKESKAGEERVSLTPNLVAKFAGLGLTVKMQSNAGDGIFAADNAYNEVEFISEPTDLYNLGDLIIKVLPPSVAEAEKFKEGAVLISFLYPHLYPEVVEVLLRKNITSFAMEMVPRISRAQDIDALSSQATIAGYKAVLLAANHAKFFFPMLTTAAGSIRPAKVLVIGAGVAGLQAIATAKRLGAIVEAYDVRSETKEQVASLGAKFVDIGIQASGTGGYARELTAEERAAQRLVLKKHVSASDVIITTAGVPGKPAPKIIFEDMIAAMKPGSIIVDLMAEAGGNCELVTAGSAHVHCGVTLIGAANIYSSLAVNASEMYARNILNFLHLIVKDGAINLNWQDEIVKGSAVTHAGKMRSK